MMRGPLTVMRSAKWRGVLWIVAGAPMVLGPVLFDGQGSAVTLGIVFLIFGIVTLTRARRDA